VAAQLGLLRPARHRGAEGPSGAYWICIQFKDGTLTWQPLLRFAGWWIAWGIV
jgi:hypothetical protein